MCNLSTPKGRHSIIKGGYQGRLNSGGNPVSGNYDIQFALYLTNVDGTVYAGPVTNYAVVVTNGLFTTTVDFGLGIYNGASNWLQIAVSTNEANVFTTLSPRQQVMPVPYAIFANTASNLLGTLPASQLSGPISSDQFGGTYNGIVSLNNPGNSFSGNGIGLTNTVTADNYVFAYALSPQTTGATNVFQNVFFNVNGLIGGWSYTVATQVFTCNQACFYLVQYSAEAASEAGAATDSLRGY